MTVSEAQALILQDTNDFRVANGKPPLLLMPELTAIAQGWSEHMAETDTYEHNPGYFVDYPPGWTQGAENIAAFHKPQDVVQVWIDSGLHRDNLLGDYTHICIGYGYDTTSTWTRYYTQNFARYEHP